MRSILTKTLAAIVALAVAGGAGWWLWGEAGSGGTPPAAAQGAAERATPVEASEVEVGNVADQVTVAGTLRSNESVQVSSELAGLISAIGFAEGEPVAQGALLFELDDAIYRAELAEAEARLALGERNYERAIELLQKNVGTARARDEAVAELETARAALGLARARLEKTEIEAPFGGIVGLRRVSIGEYVTPGQELVNLEDIDRIKVDFRIPERFLSAVRTGQPVEITVEALRGRTFEGEVYAIDPLIDPEGRSIGVRARLDNSERVLRPGLFARVNLITERRENAVLVPEQALVPQGARNFVFKVVGGEAVMTEVVVGQRREGQAEITSGLAPGDVVVTAGQMKIRDGAPVEVLQRDGVS